MAIPAPEKIEEIVAPVLADLHLDVEDVKVIRAGAKSQLTIAVDGDKRPDLDVLEAVTQEVSTVLDAAERTGAINFGNQPYTLEVSTPGIDAPLTKPRHWRRNRGRKVSIRLNEGEQLIGRVGALADDEAAVILITSVGPKGRPKAAAQAIQLAHVTTAVVQVEFSSVPAVEEEIVGLDFDDALSEAGGNDK